MNTVRQLSRQPIKTTAIILLIALAVAVLCVSMGQAMAANSMEAALDDRFTTTALATNKYQYYRDTYYLEELQQEINSITILMEKPEEIRELMLSLDERYPEYVEAIHSPGLATAYIPELTAANSTELVSNSTSDGGFWSTSPSGAPYTQVVARITLTEVCEPEYYYYDELDNLGTVGAEVLQTLDASAVLDALGHPQDLTQEELDGLLPISVELTGTVEQVYGLQEGYADPTGYTARMTLILPDRASLEELELEIGGEYMVYGMDYYDNDWSLRNMIFSHAYGINSAEFGSAVSATAIDAFDPEKLVMLTQEQIDGYNMFYVYANAQYPPEYQVAYYIHEEVREDGSTAISRCINLTNLDMLNYRSVSFTLCDLSAMSPELGEEYAVPTITKMEGSAEEILESALWDQALNRTNISNHSYAVIGVDDLGAVGSFAEQSTWIAQGRDFREKELAEGARVCILSAHLAERNGLSVGDTVSLQYLNYDWEDPYQNFLSDGYGITAPGGYFYSTKAGFAGEGEEYTIVGLYEMDYLWKGASTLYAVTPNTVFVPKAAVTGDMDYNALGVFYTAVLKNGTMDSFADELTRLGEEGLFQVDDQGYAEVFESLHDYKEVARQAMVIGLGVYGIIMLVFLLFYPGMQRKALITMWTLGAAGKEKRGHMAAALLGVLIPGTVAGLVFGCLLWSRVVAELMDSARVVLELELNVPALMLIAAVQFTVMLGLALLVSLPLTRDGAMGGRSGLFRRFLRRLGRMQVRGWNVLLFAAVIALALCALHASNEAELTDYERACIETPVKVTLLDANSHDAYGLNTTGAVTDLFTIERFARFTPLKYLEDLQFMCSLWANAVNGQPVDMKVSGMTSEADPPDLSDRKECEILWEEGCGYWVFDETERMYVLLPENHGFTDWDPEEPGFQILVRFENEVFAGYKDASYGEKQGEPLYELREKELTATVAGTYTNSVSCQTVFCSYRPLQEVTGHVGRSLSLDHISGTLINNGEAGDLREMANQWFADPAVPESAMNKSYALDIDMGVLENLKVTLENSMTVNRVCTVLVLVLSAGAGFFLGFLMIRSRKREIILMRTLGKPQSHIFRDFAWEQMRFALLGTFLGGLVFRWEPAERLGLFLGIYLAGLAAALLLFLNSTLLTTIKEDD